MILVAIPVIFSVTVYVGSIEETVAMLVLTWQCKDLEGADKTVVVQNIITIFGL